MTTADLKRQIGFAGIAARLEREHPIRKALGEASTLSPSAATARTPLSPPESEEQESRNATATHTVSPRVNRGGTASTAIWAAVVVLVVIILLWSASFTRKIDSVPAPAVSDRQTQERTPTQVKPPNRNANRQAQSNDRGPTGSRESGPTAQGTPGLSTLGNSTGAAKSPIASKPAEALNEETPPVGENNILSETQIRYCSAQMIRVDSVRPSIDSYNHNEVNFFNALVADFNSRCAKFRYHPGSLERARAMVESHRSQIESDAREVFLNRFRKRTEDVRLRDPTPMPVVPQVQPQSQSESPPVIESPQSQAKLPQSRAQEVDDQSPESNALLTLLGKEERERVRQSCASIKDKGEYLSCARRQLPSTRTGARNLELLSDYERRLLEKNCETAKQVGQEAYFRCVSEQLRRIGL